MSGEEKLVRQVENLQVSKDDLEETELWEHCELSSTTELERQDFKETYSNFVLNLNGVDLDFKTMALYTAVHNKLKDESCIQYSACNGCGKDIDSSTFAEEFVDAYHRKMVTSKARFAGGIARKAYNLARKNWISAILNICRDILPAIEQYVSTNPSRLNEDESFPYYVDDNGTVYHHSCYKKYSEDD